MAGEKLTWAKKGFDLSNITWSLTSLMTSITSWLKDFMDSIKDKFNLDIFNTTKEIKLELNELKKLIDDDKDKEAKKLINTSKEFTPAVNRLNDNFDKKRVEKESEEVYLLFLEKNKEDGSGISDKELELILGVVDKDKKYIENTENKWIREIINNIDTNYTISEIIVAHKKLKTQEKEITKEAIILEIDNSKKPEEELNSANNWDNNIE